MAVTLNPDLLCENLKKAQKRDISSNGSLKDPPPEPSKGLQYLIENVMEPMSDGIPVHSASLDFSQFNESDLEDLYYYYMDIYYDGTKDWYNLKTVYAVCMKATSQTAPIQFL